MKATDWIRTAWGITSESRWYARPLHFLNWWLFTNRVRWLYRAARWLEGARPVPTGRIGRDVDEISGFYFRRVDSTELNDDWCGTVKVEFSGACPVQGEGHVFGYPCYYRSRGEGWQFYVAATKDGDPLDDDAWFYSERPYIFPEGGWVHEHVSQACISRAVDAWLDYRYEQFTRQKCAELAHAAGLSCEEAARRLSSVNYSSAREAAKAMRHARERVND